VRPVPGLIPALAFLAGFWTAIACADASLSALAGPEAELHERVNAIRREHHLLPLRGSLPLAEVAQRHANDMASRDYVAHVDPDGHDPLDRVQRAGVDGFRLLAENIGASNVGGDRLASITEEWLRSPLHRENLLNPAFNASGIGIVETPDGRTLVVQLYATF
jgi:uncharacterized protein YkwD